MAVSKTDITVRLQRLACCIGTKTHKLAKLLKYGSNDIECEFNKLRLLLNYSRILKSYQTILDEEPAYAIYDANDWSAGTNFNLTMYIVRPSQTPSSYTFNALGQTSNDNALAAIATAINANTTAGFTAEYSSSLNLLTVTCPEDYGDTPNDTWYVQFSATGSAPPTINVATAYFDEGVDERVEDDLSNCITEEELLNIFEQISKTCKICFQPLGYNYKEQIDLTDTRVTEDGEERIEESGETRIIE